MTSQRCAGRGCRRQVRVAVGRLHFDDTFAHFENGDIECAAAEVVHGDGLSSSCRGVGKRGCRSS